MKRTLTILTVDKDENDVMIILRLCGKNDAVDESYTAATQNTFIKRQLVFQPKSHQIIGRPGPDIHSVCRNLCDPCSGNLDVRGMVTDFSRPHGEVLTFSVMYSDFAVAPEVLELPFNMSAGANSVCQESLDSMICTVRATQASNLRPKEGRFAALKGDGHLNANGSNTRQKTATFPGSQQRALGLRGHRFRNIDVESEGKIKKTTPL